jgi:hypothetical protein
MRRDVFSLSGPAAFVALPRSSTAFMNPLNLFWMLVYCSGNFGMVILLPGDAENRDSEMKEVFLPARPRFLIF